MTSEMLTCPQIPLTDLLSFVVDNRGKTVPTAESGHVLIATNCIKNEALYPVFEKVRYLSDETYRTWFRAHPQPGDIIFVNKGTPGRVCMVPDPVNFCIAQDMIALRVDGSKIYNKFLFAVLRGWDIQTQIYNTNVGDVIPHYKKSFLDQLLIPLPSMDTQRRIGDLYFDLSEKAAKNTSINHHLEQMAQAIFKSWFVDFEPFGGEMPEDWQEGTLSDICFYNSERIPVASLTVDTYISTENMLTDKSGFVRAASLPMIPQTISFSVGDTLVSNIRPYFKKIVYCGFSGGCSTDVLCFRPHKVSFSLYLYNVLYNDRFFGYMVAGSKGTKMPRGDKKQIMNYHVVIPSDTVLDDFTILIAPMIEKRLRLTEESARLTELRDTLLPRLMSGGLSVVDLDDAK